MHLGNQTFLDRKTAFWFWTGRRQRYLSSPTVFATVLLAFNGRHFGAAQRVNRNKQNEWKKSSGLVTHLHTHGHTLKQTHIFPPARFHACTDTHKRKQSHAFSRALMHTHTDTFVEKICKMYAPWHTTVALLKDPILLDLNTTPRPCALCAREELVSSRVLLLSFTQQNKILCWNLLDSGHICVISLRKGLGQVMLFYIPGPWVRCNAS